MRTPISAAAASDTDVPAGSSSDDLNVSSRTAASSGGGRRGIVDILRGRSHEATPVNAMSGDAEHGEVNESFSSVGVAITSIGVGTDRRSTAASTEDVDGESVDASVQAEEDDACEGGLLGAASTPGKAEADQAESFGMGPNSAAEAQLLPLDDEEGSCVAVTAPQTASALATSSEGPQAPPDTSSFSEMATRDKKMGSKRPSVFRSKRGGSSGSSSSIFRRGKASDVAAAKPDSTSNTQEETCDDFDEDSSSDSDKSCHSSKQTVEQMSMDKSTPAAQDADLVNMLMMSSPKRGQKSASARASARAAARRSRAKRNDESLLISDDENDDDAAVAGAAVHSMTSDQSQNEGEGMKNSGPVDAVDFGEESSSDEEAFEASKGAMTYSKYDYDMNWDMIGLRRRIEDNKDESIQKGGENQQAGSADKLANEDSDAALVGMDDRSSIEETASSSAASAAAMTGRSVASGTAGAEDGGASVVVVSTGATEVAPEGTPSTQLSIQPSPRRRTRSSPAGTISSMMYAPAVPARTRKQYYAYQRRDLLDDESDVDINIFDHNDREFDDITNWHDGDDGNGEIDEGMGGDQLSSARCVDEFDDFAGSPVLPHHASAIPADATSEAGNESVHTAEGGASVSTGSSSSSSSIRRRGHLASSSRSVPPSFGPGGVSVGFGAGTAGHQSAPSVSSFTTSTSSMPAGPSSRPSSRRRLNPRAVALSGRRRGGQSSTRATEGSGDSSSGGGVTAAASRIRSSSSSSSALRSSLDAGMAALRRWARSRTVTASVPNVGSGPRPSRAVETQLRLGEEDIFALSNAGSRDLQRDPEVGGLSVTRSHDYDEEFRHDIFGMRRMYPPPIAEEEDEAGISGDGPSGRGGIFRGLRQRAFSEPDRAVVMREIFPSMGRTRVGGGWRRRGSRQRTDGNSISEPSSPQARRQPIGGSSDRPPRRRRQRQRQIQRQQLHGSSDDDSRDADATDQSSTGAGRSASFVSSNDTGGSRRIISAPLNPPYLSSTALSASSLFQSPEHAPASGVRDPLDSLESGRITGVGAVPLSQLRSRHSGDEATATGVANGGGRDSGNAEEGNDDEIGGALDGNTGASGVSPTVAAVTDEDPNREARGRWIRINRRFQLIITIVALIFSMLLFAILVCWVVLTSAYVVSIDKMCDVPLKTYFWLATLQLILDVFRTDIIRFVLRWDANSRQRMPLRVIVYNIAYLVYAVMVLRMGARSVFATDDTTCPRTAPELFQTSMVFVILSLAAWSTIVMGYLGPFCFVAIVLTRNGYSPSADIDGSSVTTGGPIPGVGGVFPVTYSSNAAPSGTVDRLRVVLLDEFPEEYPKECCICMGDFTTGEIIVATECDHVFHKRCCQEWLRQARTCPVCRTDIPNSLPGRGSNEDEMRDEESFGGRDYNEPPNRLPLNREEFHHEVVNLLRMLRRHEEMIRERINPQTDGNDVEMQDRGSSIPNRVTVDAEPNVSSSMRSAEEGRSVTNRRSRTAAV